MSRCFVILTLLLCAPCVAADSNPPRESGDSIVVTCHGKLRCGNVAIGGETTGTTITFDRFVWELNLSDDASKKFAQAHHKELVSIKGKLRRVSGTARPVRWIVDVDQIQQPDVNDKDASSTTTVQGKLHEQDGGLAISCNDITWPIDVSQHADLKAKADSLIGKTVTVKGKIGRVERAKIADQVRIEAGEIEIVPSCANSKR